MNKVGRSPSGRAATPDGAQPPAASSCLHGIPNAAALNVSSGLYLDDTDHVYPVTNWFDENGCECSREDAVTCVAGEGGCWFALKISDFSETTARA
jgi:hypothetical protein